MRRTLLLVPLAALFGCAHGSSSTNAQASAPPPEQPASQELAAVPPATTPAPTPTPVASTTCEPLRVHFAFDSSVLTDDNRAALDRSAACLKGHPHDKVSVQGNTDERGSTGYNHDLGEKRAQAVEGYLTSQGVDAKQIDTVSFGKDNPLCTQGGEDCWQKNRRASIEPACRM